jgi:plasmid stabilization system protein ParE
LPAAQADLIALYDYISEQSGATVALGYIDRIEPVSHGRAETAVHLTSNFKN